MSVNEYLCMDCGKWRGWTHCLVSFCRKLLKGSKVQEKIEVPIHRLTTQLLVITCINWFFFFNGLSLFVSKKSIDAIGWVTH